MLGAPVRPALRSNMLVAHLGTVGPNMTLLEVLQSREATDAIRTLERARDSPRPPLDICLQVGALSSKCSGNHVKSSGRMAILYVKVSGSRCPSCHAAVLPMQCMRA